MRVYVYALGRVYVRTSPAPPDFLWLLLIAILRIMWCARIIPRYCSIHLGTRVDPSSCPRPPRHAARVHAPPGRYFRSPFLLPAPPPPLTIEHTFPRWVGTSKLRNFLLKTQTLRTPGSTNRHAHVGFIATPPPPFPHPDPPAPHPLTVNRDCSSQGAQSRPQKPEMAKHAACKGVLQAILSAMPRCRGLRVECRVNQGLVQRLPAGRMANGADFPLHTA